MKKSIIKSCCGCGSNRREFIKKSAIVGAGALLAADFINFACKEGVITPLKNIYGSAAGYIPKVRAAFVRREGEYGMKWPGAIYDGEAAFKNYSKELKQTAEDLNISLNLRELPIYNINEANLWVHESQDQNIDGLFVIVLDRQQHAWPTARIAAESGIPTIIYSPLGTSFTTNTMNLADKQGCVIYSTDNFKQAAFGLKMISAGARMRQTKCVVIKGKERVEKLLSTDTGITLQYIPANSFIKAYNEMPMDEEIAKMADEYIKKAKSIKLATRDDVLNGVKSYLVAGKFLQDENADAISMDCLGALGNVDVSLPCIAWSKMNDDGIPAACEADVGAIASHILVQYLFDRPGFQQDPVADTSDDTIIGAHCSCPTRLNGFDLPPEPFDLTHHHGDRDAVPRTIWKVGQRVTMLDFFPDENQSKLLFSTGKVVDNLSVPPSGGCVVSVKYKMDGDQNVLSYPGFHQLFFYGDYKKELTEFSQLFNFKPELI